MTNKLSELRTKFNLNNDYFEIVSDAANNEENFEIQNSTLEHAKFLIYLLISKAEKEINIYSGNLDKDCWDNPDIKEILKEAVERGIKIKVIVRDGDNIATIFHELNIDVERLTKGIKGMPIDNHFMVCDGKSYRMEAKHETEVEFVKARANFNNSGLAKPLNDFFNKLEDLSEVI